MIRTSTRWRLAAAASPLALMIAATPAWGQDTSATATTAAATPAITGETSSVAAQPTTPPPSDTAANPQNTDQSAQDNIVVTGFRASLRSSTAKKKNSETVVELVTAEDIGKLPDNSIGESIARLPGVAAQRNNGRANIISIRGFGPDFSTTTLNGRQQTTTNDSRAVEFDQYPSEILAGVDVYKTAEADHTAGGLVGSIDLRTIRPLDYGHRVIAVGVRGTYVDQKLLPEFEGQGRPRVRHLRRPVRARHLRHRAFGGVHERAIPDARLERLGLWWLSGRRNRHERRQDVVRNRPAQAPRDDRDRAGAAQRQSDDDVRRLLFALRRQHRPKRLRDAVQLRRRLRSTIRSRTSPARTGSSRSATIAGTPVIENYATDHKSDQYALGWNTLWDGHNGWKAMADFSWSKTDRAEHHIETTAGLINGAPLQRSDRDRLVPVTDHGPEFDSNYNAANPALVLTDVEGWSGSPVQAGYDKLRKSKDDLKESHGEIEREIGSFIKSIKVGVDYTDHDKTLSQDEGFLAPPNGALSSGDPGRPVAAAVQPRPWIRPDTFVGSAGARIERHSCLRPEQSAEQRLSCDREGLDALRHGAADGQLGAATLTGNIGFQAVHTDRHFGQSGISRPNTTNTGCGCPAST